jgi:hypothetical protein
MELPAIRGRLLGAFLLALGAPVARPAYAQLQNNTQSIHVAVNNGTILVTNGDQTAAYAGAWREVDEAMVLKIAEVVIAASATDWVARLGATLQGISEQRDEIRSLLRDAARREAALGAQVRELRSRLDALARAEERNASSVRSDLDQRLDELAVAWKGVAVELREGARATKGEVERLARTLHETTLRLEQSVAMSTYVGLTAFFGPDPALRTMLAFRGTSFAFPSVDAELAGSYAWRLSHSVQVGPVLGFAYCCLGPATQAGGFVAPTGTALEIINYRAERLTFEVGHEIRVRAPWTGAVRLLGHVLYRQHFVRWAPEERAAPSARYTTPAIACRAGFDIRLFGPLVVGLSVGAEYDVWTKDPMWRYTGFLGTTIDPVRLGGAFEVDAGMHLGLTVLH